MNGLLLIIFIETITKLTLHFLYQSQINKAQLYNLVKQSSPIHNKTPQNNLLNTNAI